MPLRVFDVAIRKREIASSAVAIRRQVCPSLVGPVGDSDKTDIEKGIFNDPLVVIDQHKVPVGGGSMISENLVLIRSFQGSVRILPI